MGQVISFTGTLHASRTGARAVFHPARATPGPDVVPATPGLSSSEPLSRHPSARALSPNTRSAQYPLAGETPAAAWRNLTGHSESGFFDEAEAQRLTLGPRLPHQRHPMTADEALAGIALAIALVIGAFALIWTWLR